MALKKTKNILSYLKDKTCDYEDRVALGTKDIFGWKEFTYKGLGLLSRKLARYIIEDLQIEKGERLAILSESKPEYGVSLFASVLSGLVTVPLDVKLTEYELKSILDDAAPSIILVSQHYLETAKLLRDKLPSLKHIIVMDENFNNGDIKCIYQLPDIYDAKWRTRSSKSTALIIYTSGTTGAPKGVEITFKNVASQLEDLKYAFSRILPERNIKTLSILPMNHLFEMTVGFSSFLSFGFSVYYTQSLKPKDILSIMRKKQIEFMIVVPAFLKLLKTTIENDLKHASKKERLMFDISYKAAKFLPFYWAKKMLFKNIHKQFGGHFIGCLSGGAPLDVKVGRFFERIGIKIFQGYGLSEASPVVSINLDKRSALGSVGKPLKQYTVKIDENTGELLLKGPSVMKGYHNQPELTNTVIDEEGWLHTGDLAKLERDGHIYITGRIKNMIVLSGGKKVFPEEVEMVFEKSKYIQDICVLGVSRTFGTKDGTEEVTAVVVPKSNLYDEYSQEDVEKLVKADIKVLSQRLTSYKRPSNVIIRREPLERTTTQKVKRKKVLELVKNL